MSKIAEPPKTDTDALSLLMAEKAAAAAAATAVAAALVAAKDKENNKEKKTTVKKGLVLGAKRRQVDDGDGGDDDDDDQKSKSSKKKVAYEDEDGDQDEDLDEKRGKKSSRGRGRGGGGGSVRGPRTSAVKLELEKKLLEKELEYRDVTITRLEQSIDKLEQQIAKLEKQLVDERLSHQRFQQNVDGQKTNMMADLTYHMAKSHHSAMHTIQTSQVNNAQVLASALGQSISRLKDKGNRLKELMPPLPDMKQPNAKQIYHEQVANLLNKTVTKLEEGEALLKKIDTTIADTQQVIDDERKRISPNMTQQELTDLTATLEEEQTRIAALKYERDMLAVGLAKQYATNSKTQPTPTPPTPTPTPTTQSPIVAKAPVAVKSK